MAADEEEEINQNQLSLLHSFLKSVDKYAEELKYKPLYLPLDTNSASLKSVLELESYSSTFISQFPDLYNLTHLLAHLKTLIDKLKSSPSYSVTSFFFRRLIEYQIYGAAFSIREEIRSWFDRDTVRNLLRAMKGSDEEEEKVKVLLVQFKDRVSIGFDKELQDLILREKVFSMLESSLCDDSCPQGVREKCAMAIAALAGFNKNVFVGLILMGFSVGALVRIGSAATLHVLNSLIRLIKSHLVDELDLNGEIPRIISKLNSDDSCVQKMAMDCVLEMGYFGRKEVIEMLLECGLIEKLVYMDRVRIKQLLGDGDGDGDGDGEVFSGCISRFAVQVEVGEAMDKVERKAVKMEIMRRAREACVSEAEAAAVLAQLLWGSSP